MIGKILGYVGLGALVAVLAVTNPDQEAYADFAAETLATEARTALCEQENGLGGLLGEIGDVIGETLGNLCDRALTEERIIGQENIEQFISENTQRQNFLVFSIYTTEIPAVRVKSVGVLNRFIPFEQSVGQQ